MMDEEVDMDDIESRLYSQVYHASADKEQNLSLNIEVHPRVPLHLNPHTVNNVPKQSNRYFNKEPVNQPTYISFDDLNSLQNNISVSPSSTEITTEGNFSNQFQNNITVNQYTLPVIINSELNEALNPAFGGKYFTSWAVKNKKLLGEKRRSKRLEVRKEMNKEKRRQDKVKDRGNSVLVNMTRNLQKKVNDVICLSDSDDDECIIQDVGSAIPIASQSVYTGFPKKYNENDKTSKKPESDNDDIIYIPPPPIEVVTVDSDDKEQETVEASHSTVIISPKCTVKLSPNNTKVIQKENRDLGTLETSASNDFLENVSVENTTNNFNFSLHGSDFNNSQGEFVRPAKPVDFCETESSCSTNELNRDFNNSVNTVVFDEVEFPREDIFSENNLEKFGSYITPKRNTSKGANDNAVSNSGNSKTSKEINVDSSSDSSSESDYEPSKCISRNLRPGGLESSKKLPNLSPMLSDKLITEVTTPKKTSSKRKTASQFFKAGSSSKVSATNKKDLNKRKSDVIDLSDTGSDTSKEGPSETPKSASRKQPKKKKKMCKSFEDVDIREKNATDDTPFKNCTITSANNSDTRKKKKKKQALQTAETDNLGKPHNKKSKKGPSETNNSESGENTDEGTLTPQKRKKKTPLEPDLYEIENSLLANILAQKIAEENVGLDLEKPQNKKKKGLPESNSSDNGENSVQKKKRKNSLETKTPENENDVPSVSVQQAEVNITHDENVRLDDSETSQDIIKTGISEATNSENEENTVQKKKRKNSLESKTLYDENDTPIMLAQQGLENIKPNASENCRSKKKKGSSESISSGNGDMSDANILHTTQKNDDLEKSQDRMKTGISEANNSENEENTIQKKKKRCSLDSKTPYDETDILVQQVLENINPDASEKSRSRKKKGSSESISSGNEDMNDANILHTTRKKKKRNSSGSSSPENNIATLESQVQVKNKKDRSMESAKISELKSINLGDIREKPKKKKKKNVTSENSETNVPTGEKLQKLNKISFSELLNQQPTEIGKLIGKIDAEVQRNKKKSSSPPPAITVIENVCLQTKSDEPSSEVHLNSPQVTEERTGESKPQYFDANLLGHNLQTEIPIDVINQVETPTMNKIEDNYSDEEFIVVDDIDVSTTSSELIVVDEAECTINVESDIAVVVSSDSEYDFEQFDDVGKDLKLANCSVEPDVAADDSEELIVVDDNSGSNFASRFAFDEKYANFDVKAIHSTQSDDPEMWKISHKDRVIELNRDKKRGPRCNRCQRFGHIAIKCTEKISPPQCSLCGNPGHQEARCPNKMCTQCGNAGAYSTTYCWKCFKFRSTVCKLCNMKGHIAKTCPDLWRRYHLTTDEGPVVVPEEPHLISKDQLWCSGCARQGHSEHECNNYNRVYLPTTPYIVSYENVLHQEGSNVLAQKIKDPPSTVTSDEQIAPSHCPTLENLPSTSRNTDMRDSSNAVPHSSITPMSQVSPDSVEGMVIPSGGYFLNEASDDIDEASTKVLNPFSAIARYEASLAQDHIIESKKLFTDNLRQMKERKYKHLIMKMSGNAVRLFLIKAMAQLDKLARHGDARFLKKKFSRISKMGLSNKKMLSADMVHEKCYWYKVLNMFIFGVHKFKDGSLHVKYLRKYLSESKQNKLDENKRKSLLSAYSYIFGVDCHADVNYFKILKQLMWKNESNIK